MTTKKDPKKAEHYVNNKEFTAAVDDFNQVSQEVNCRRKGNS